MPLFEFRCPTCAHDFEQLVRGSEAITCPTCGTGKVEKLFSEAAGVRVGGSSLPLMGSSCPPSDAPPCSPRCCRLPQ